MFTVSRAMLCAALACGLVGSGELRAAINTAEGNYLLGDLNGDTADGRNDSGTGPQLVLLSNVKNGSTGTANATSHAFAFGQTLSAGATAQATGFGMTSSALGRATSVNTVTVNVKGKAPDEEVDYVWAMDYTGTLGRSAPGGDSSLGFTTGQIALVTIGPGGAETYKTLIDSRDVPQLNQILVPEGTAQRSFHVTNGHLMTFTIEVSAVAIAQSYSDLTFTSTVDFTHTFTWGGIKSAHDSHGNPIPLSDITLFDEDGIDWALPIPEPTSLAVLIPLAAFTAMRRGVKRE